MIELKGMTWSHDRGIRPLEAASQHFSKMHPELRIIWDARPLADFELYPLDQLASRYDFIMIDHPHIGAAVARGILLDLDSLLTQDFLRDQEACSVGPSYDSYHWKDRQWALPVDAAAQVSAWRPDLLTGLEIPGTWSEVFKMQAGFRSVFLAMPFVPVHAYSCFFTLCSQLGRSSFWSDSTPLSRETGKSALELLRQLLDLAHPSSFDMDPIAILDLMGEENTIAYVPLVYGYSNYARKGYMKSRVSFGNIPSETGLPEGSMIGGVGLAVSSFCREKMLAAAFLEMVGTADYQRNEFFREGGQPGHRAAWMDSEVNKKAGNFFSGTLKTLDAASMRPRFDGYVEFQGEAGQRIRSFIKEGRRDSGAFIDELNTLFFAAKRKGSQ